MSKSIILCADDFAFSTEVSEGIIELIKKQRLSAVSCMSSMPFWKQHAELLKPFIGKVDIGLHFNLTDGAPVNSKATSFGGQKFNSLKKLIAKSYLHQVSFDEVKKELELQLDQFRLQLGCEPDFIDGHQHIHQLPIIRDALCAVYKEQFADVRPYIRIPANHTSKPSAKERIIKLLGSNSLTRLLEINNIPYNKNFSGIYNFAQAENYQNIFRKFLDDVPDGTLIMCHPGLKTLGDSDSIAHSRWHEFQYFRSDEFIEDCKYQEIKLARF